WLGWRRLWWRRLWWLRLLLSRLGSSASAAGLLLRRCEQRRLGWRRLLWWRRRLWWQRLLWSRRLLWWWRLWWLVICRSKAGCRRNQFLGQEPARESAVGLCPVIQSMTSPTRPNSVPRRAADRNLSAWSYTTDP